MSKIWLFANCSRDLKRPSFIITHRLSHLNPFKSSRHRNPSQAVHMLNQHSLSWNAVQWWHATHISKLWLSHNMSRMKSQRPCVAVLSWESPPSASWGRADGGSCVNIPLRPGSESDSEPLSHEEWSDSGGKEYGFQYGVWLTVCAGSLKEDRFGDIKVVAVTQNQQARNRKY